MLRISMSTNGNAAIAAYKAASKRKGETVVIASASDLRFAKQRVLQELGVSRSNQKFFEHIERIASSTTNAKDAARAVAATKMLVTDYRRLLDKLERYDLRKGRAISLFPLNSDVGTRMVSTFIRRLKTYQRNAPIGFRNRNTDRLKRVGARAAPTTPVDTALAGVKRAFAGFERAQKQQESVAVNATQRNTYLRHAMDELALLQQNKVIYETILERARLEGRYVQETKTVLALFQKYIDAYKSAIASIRRRPKSVKTGLARGSGAAFGAAANAFFDNVMRRVTREGNLSLVINSPVRVPTRASAQRVSPVGVLDLSTSRTTSPSPRSNANARSIASSATSNNNKGRKIFDLSTQVRKCQTELSKLERELKAAKDQASQLQKASMNDLRRHDNEKEILKDYYKDVYQLLGRVNRASDGKSLSNTGRQVLKEQYDEVMTV